MPDEPFHNFGASKSVPRHLWTTWSSPISWFQSWKTVKCSVRCLCHGELKSEFRLLNKAAGVRTYVTLLARNVHEPRPTGPFIISQPHNQDIDECYLFQERIRFWSSKFVKGSVGRYYDTLTYSLFNFNQRASLKLNWPCRILSFAEVRAFVVT